MRAVTYYAALSSFPIDPRGHKDLHIGWYPAQAFRIRQGLLQEAAVED